MSSISENGPMLARFKELILLHCGFSLEMGREQTLVEGLRSRMAARGMDEPAAYHAVLVRERDELHSLVELLTVNETYFFREPDHLNLAIDQLLPEFLPGPGCGPVRILSAGCSTGEEPYSIAMMLRERYGAQSERLFAVSGVDIDSSAIACARRGVYGKGSFRGMDQGMLNRYFEPAGPAQLRVREEIGKRVFFEVANLLGPAYPQGMQRQDLIFYRNVSIYFPQEVQRRIFAGLAGLLNEGGYLIVGATETIHHDIGILSLVERGALFVYRKTRIAHAERRGSRREEPGRPRPAAAAARSSAPLSAGSRDNRMPRQQPMAGPGKRPSSYRDLGVLFDSALDLARKGQTDQALEFLDAILERDPCFAKAGVLKGSLLMSDARFGEAAAISDSLLARDPLCLEAYLMLGTVARHQGKEEDAFRRFREAAYLDPSCWFAHFYSAEILFAQGDAKQARTGYETASRILEKGGAAPGQAFFPLAFNAEQFIVICRHKLSLLKENR